ncbi:MAG: c-type cytochrome biogenesis protein CcsB [Candidatus Sulfobium sp.]|jgi:cytochrome c-type biogenesis protein CcsB
MEVMLFEIALTFYFASAIVCVMELFKGTKTTSTIMLVLAGVGFLFHTSNIIARYVISGHIPIANLHEATSFFAWCIVLIFFFLEYRYKLGLLGSFIMPVVFVLMFSSSVLPRKIEPLSPVLQSYWLGIHTVLAFLGDAAFALAFGVGIMYLIQEHHVKSKHLGGLFERLPSLQILDEINYRLITLGFPLLTLAIITGAIWAENAWGKYWQWDPKEVWSLITWLIYAVVLHLRLTAGWRGRRAAILAIVGFVVVLFTFFGVNFILKSMHTF